MRRTTALTLILALAAASLLSSCGDDKDIRPEPQPVEAPEPYTLDDTATPHADVPADMSDLTPPLDQTGGDNGDEGLLYSALLGGYYIMRIQQDDGSFMYRYDPGKDEWTWEDSLPRQGGSTYSTSYVYEISQREEFRVAAEFAHAYLNTRWPEDGDLSYRFPIAHWIIGLHVHSRAVGNVSWGEPLGFDVQQRLSALGEFLLAEQNEDGSFRRMGYHAGGQFLQSMWALYEHFGDERYLDALEAGARYFYDNEGVHDYHLFLAVWGIEPMVNLHAIRPADWIEDFVWKLADPIVEAQRLPEQGWPRSHWGSYFMLEVTDPGAYSMYATESLCDAWILAERVGDEERAATYKDSVYLASDFLQYLQYRQGDTDHYVQGEMVIGGIPFGISRPALRVDITRHIINTFIKIAVYFGLEDYPGAPWPQPYRPGGEIGRFSLEEFPAAEE